MSELFFETIPVYFQRTSTIIWILIHQYRETTRNNLILKVMDIFGKNNNFKSFEEMINYVKVNSDIYLSLLAVAISTNVYAAREQGCKDEIKHFKIVFGFKPLDV